MTVRLLSCDPHGWGCVASAFVPKALSSHGHMAVAPAAAMQRPSRAPCHACKGQEVRAYGRRDPNQSNVTQPPSMQHALELGELQPIRRYRNEPAHVCAPQAWARARR